LEKEEKHMHEELGKLEDQEDLLRRQQAAFEAEKRRQEEAARKAAAERAAAEAAAKKAAAEKAAAEKASSNSGSSSNDDEQEEKATPEPVVSSSLFIKPANGYFSSGFGHRWGSMHPGVDIARGGSVPVVASASGTVIKSYYSSSYGNVIFIAHYLNGRTYTTVYAHLRTRYVGNGATVNKGEQIGLMGNTGRSTGQHLHFEIHQGSWNYNKSNAINPRQFF
jgi:murein DD-endopeptidase MepM/ murein hydrolase activator NlpD